MSTLEEIVDRASREAVDEDVLRDRYRGALVGAAIGNALGVEVEGWNAEAIGRRFPGGIRDIDLGERDRPWDDDVAQTVLLAEAIAERGRLDRDDLRARFLRWYRESGRGVGQLTAQVIHEMERGTPDAARQVWERGGRQSAGNGAVMRCAPVALAWRRSGARLIEEARASAVITHHDPRCEWSTVATCVALSVVLSGGRVELEALAQAMAADGSPDEVTSHVRAVEGAELGSLTLDDWAMGYTLKAMQVGLWCLAAERDPEEALVEVIGAGGDTDTNGAVAGAALGAVGGASAWPDRWLQSIRDRSRLAALAEALLQLAQHV